MTPSDVDQTPTTRLRRGSIGMWDLVFFVVAAAAPLSVMSGVAPLAIQFGGIGAPAGYLVAGLVFVIFAVGFTAMSRQVPDAGAFYAYIGVGLNRRMGAGAAVVAVVSYNAIAIGFLPAVGVFAQATLADMLHVDVAWYWCAAVALVVVGFLGYNRISLSAKVLGVFLVLEVLVLLVLAVPVIVQGGAEGLSALSFEPSQLVGPGTGALFVLSFGAFLGFESTAIYSEEARDPVRTVRRATFAAVGFMAVFYALIVWSVLMAFGPERALAEAVADPTGMFFTAMSRWVGTPATDAMHVLIVVSALACTLAFHNASARYLFVLGRSGLLPSWLGRARAGKGGPANASLAQTVLTALVVAVLSAAGLKPYEQTFLWLNGIGIVGVIALQAVCSLAVVAYFRRRRGLVHPLQGLVAPTASGLALAAVVVLILRNFELLTQAGPLVNVLLLLPLPLAFAYGALRAGRR